MAFVKPPPPAKPDPPADDTDTGGTGSDADTAVKEAFTLADAIGKGVTAGNIVPDATLGGIDTKSIAVVKEVQKVLQFTNKLIDNNVGSLLTSEALARFVGGQNPIRPATDDDADPGNLNMDAIKANAESNNNKGSSIVNQKSAGDTVPQVQPPATQGKAINLFPVFTTVDPIVFNWPAMKPYPEPNEEWGNGHKAVVVNIGSSEVAPEDPVRRRFSLYWRQQKDMLHSGKPMHLGYLEPTTDQNGSLLLTDRETNKVVKFVSVNRYWANEPGDSRLEEFVDIKIQQEAPIMQGGSKIPTTFGSNFDIGAYATELFQLDKKLTHLDHPFKIKIPTAYPAGTDSDIVVSMNGEYNFYLDAYEAITKTAQINEVLLPDSYAILQWTKYKGEHHKPSEVRPIMIDNYEEHITLDGDISEYLPGGALKGSSVNVDFTSMPYALYMYAWADVIKNKELDNEEMAKLLSVLKNQVFPASEYATVNQAMAMSQQFPMDVKLEFPTVYSKFAQIISSNKMDVVIPADIATFEPLFGFKQEYLETHEDGETLYGAQAKHTVHDLYKQIVSTLFIGDRERLDEQMKNYNLAVMSDGVLTMPEAGQEETELTYQVKTYLDDRVGDSVRSWWDIVRGRTATIDKVFYSIEKWAGKEYIQSYTITTPQELQQFKYAFVDTQVKYDTGYTYKFYVYTLVYGSEYSYEPVGVLPPENGYDVARIKITTRPKYWLIKMPYYNFDQTDIPSPAIPSQKTVFVFDRPPVYPNMSLVPYKGVNNKLLINLVPNGGSYRDKPIILYDQEKDMFIKAAISQGVMSATQVIMSQWAIFPSGLGQMGSAPLPTIEETNIEFQYDDRPTKFELYRLSKPPTAFKDFVKGKKYTLDFPLSSIVDDVVPNTTYYYMTRLVDAHGQVSNPSDILEMKLYDVEGMVWLEVKPYQFPKPEAAPVKTIQKYLYIRPSLIQVALPSPMPNESAKSMIKAPKIGLTDKSIFDDNKKYQIRLISRKTGRQIDLNVVFTHKHLVNDKNKKQSPSSYKVA